MRRQLLLLAALVAFPVARGAAQGTDGTDLSSPVGTWHTISDVTGQPRGIVEIREKDGTLVGIARGSLVPGETGVKLCEKCEGERHNQPILGMEILWGLRRDGDEWTGGQVLDPDTGKVYKAKIRLADGGRTLVLRGYIGFSALGRSQSWRRVPAP